MQAYPSRYKDYTTDRCPRCNGSGKHNGGVCPVCHATGLVFVCPDCQGRGGTLHYGPSGYIEPCTTCGQEGILTLEELKEWEAEALGQTPEEAMKEYRRTVAGVSLGERCDYCGTNCQSDCQHSRAWRGEVGRHKETIG